ncbi:MAG: endonuclease MutS2 [Deltaproteobacteria bacterium]|uniref:Endonuclease MutS2 n=1 Tax=Candidatus Zymogenus saltonus TaxID=2844893 RepID=A0A9D8PQ75_9DELT|nr:endonuclease MutS2 [Candidatus Zymogenus saltonus]
MDDRTLKVLEYPKILEIVSDFALTLPGTEACLRLNPLTDTGEIVHIHEIVSELRELNSIEGRIPLAGISDVSHLFERIRVEGTYLTPHEIKEIGSNITAHRRAKSFLNNLRKKYPLPAILTDPIVPLPEIEKDIERTLGPRGEILDGASDRLYNIRGDIRKKRDAINRLLMTMMESSALDNALQEPIVTMRNGRYVLPVKADFRGRVSGIIHDRSNSGATLFIEPIKTMEINNELSFLIRKENDEEVRILKLLSSKINDSRDAVKGNHGIIVELDTLIARAAAADAMGGISPEVDDSGSLSFINSVHPLLSLTDREGRTLKFDNPKAVPIDIEIGGEKRIVVLSGANTGGKTAALKTLGLLTLMFKTGIPIPASEGSRAVPFKEVFADIGDEQDIEGNLSTFSAKVTRLKYILSEAESGSLVLVDEIMSGTDPEQGGALAIAILDYLSKKNATILVTTHLNILKTYALNRDDAVNVSVVFDESTNRPLYKLNYGAPGGSNALMVARSLNLPEEVIENAKTNLTEEGRRLSELVMDLESERLKIRVERRALSDLRKSFVDLETKFKLLISKMVEKRDAILESFKEDLKETLKKYDERFKEIFAAADNSMIKKGKLHEEFYSAKRGLLDEITVSDHPGAVNGKAESEKTPSPGDTVSIKGLAVKGILIQMQHHQEGDEGKAEVEVGGRRVWIDISELKKETPVVPKGSVVMQEIYSDPKTEINIIGLRVDEAIDVVDKAIDNAVLGGFEELDIIHGRGTGRLKKGIREHLKDHRHVTEIKPEGTNMGVTTVGIR